MVHKPAYFWTVAEPTKSFYHCQYLSTPMTAFQVGMDLHLNRVHILLIAENVMINQFKKYQLQP